MQTNKYFPLLNVFKLRNSKVEIYIKKSVNDTSLLINFHYQFSLSAELDSYRSRDVWASHVTYFFVAWKHSYTKPRGFYMV